MQSNRGRDKISIVTGESNLVEEKVPVIKQSSSLPVIIIVASAAILCLESLLSHLQAGLSIIVFRESNELIACSRLR